MESPRLVKISVIVKHVTDQQDEAILHDKNSDAYLVLAGVKRVLDSMSVTKEEESVDKLVRVIDAAKLSNEVMASALIDVDREDLFNEKIETIKSLDDVIKLINTL
jgi:copper homeostasis protein CutC